MIRRLITACVLMGLFAAQWAVVPHSHGSSTDGSHNDSPHVHLAFNGDQGHRHSHDGEHLHSHACAKTDEKTDNCPLLTDVSNHDIDAVYVGSGDFPSTVSAAQSCPDQAPSAQSPALASDLSELVNSSTASIVYALASPDTGAPSCARFLSLRTLRI